MAETNTAASLEPAVESVDEVFVVFTPSGLRGSVPRGTTLLAAARKIGVDLDSVCGGRGICGRCQVQPTFGHFPKFGIDCDHRTLSEFSEVEARYEARRGLQKGRRLGCNAVLLGNMVVDVPPESQLRRQVVRKRPDARPIAIDPILRLYYVEVEPPKLDSPSGDCERLLDALQRGWNIQVSAIDLSVYTSIQDALKRGDYKVTAAVRDNDTLLAVYPGVETMLYGLAVDIGSTTMSAQLVDLQSATVIAAQGRMNPQIRFGEDLMSRVSYAMLNEGGDKAMTQSVREALDALFKEVAASSDIDPNKILEVVLVGNPIMHHIFWGIDPIPLGGAPFALASAAAISAPARECGFKSLAPGARLYTPPCIAGHVGADAAAVALSEYLWDAEEPVLAIDIGTNAEILLAVEKRVYAASSPTGPAFEGAQIEHGQRAAAGAIERIRIDEKTFEPRFKTVDRMTWSNEEGFKKIPPRSKEKKQRALQSRARLPAFAALASSRVSESCIAQDYSAQTACSARRWLQERRVCSARDAASSMCCTKKRESRESRGEKSPSRKTTSAPCSWRRVRSMRARGY